MGFLQGVLQNLPDAIGLGLIWGIMTMGVFITFRILDFPDMTVDGSFAMGGCISGGLIVNGFNPILSILVAILGGIAAGLVTGLLHTKLKIPGILAGILTMFGLYSINLRILGRPNVGILNEPTIFNIIKELLRVDNRTAAIIVGGIIAVAIMFLLYWFFGTELGSSLRATGCNEYMVRALGTSTDSMKVMGLVIANALVALSGAVYAQSQYYSDVNMGQGAIVIGLASIVIGEVLFGHRASFLVRLISVVSGSILYRIVVVIVLKLGMRSDDMKLLTALIVAIALSVPVIREKIYGAVKMRKNAAAYKEGN
ncbi:MAG: ABC transporter permease [Clostridia bacterium]